MKGIITKKKNYFEKDSFTIGKEYEILGINHKTYYIIDDFNNFGTISKDRVEIIDNKKPPFWKIDPQSNDRNLPPEWHYENFLFLSEGLDDILNREIWIETQFLKGLTQFNLTSIPNNLLFANSNISKENIIRSILKTLENYSNQFRDNGSPYLDCNFYNFKTIYETGGSRIYEMEEKLDFTDKIIDNEKSAFENLKQILSEILEFPKVEKLDDNDDLILNRIIYSIWSIFQTKEIQIITREYQHSYPEFILKTNDNCYKLTIYQDY